MVKKLYIELRKSWCSHEWQFIGRRDAKFCNRDFIYECQKCRKYDVTQIRKKEALNDIIVDSCP